MASKNFFAHVSFLDLELALRAIANLASAEAERVAMYAHRPPAEREREPWQGDDDGSDLLLAGTVSWDVGAFKAVADQAATLLEHMDPHDPDPDPELFVHAQRLARCTLQLTRERRSAQPEGRSFAGSAWTICMDALEKVAGEPPAKAFEPRRRFSLGEPPTANSDSESGGDSEPRRFRLN